MALKNEIDTAAVSSILTGWLEPKTGGERTVRVTGLSTSFIGNR
jgi:hypothetical protein